MSRYLAQITNCRADIERVAGKSLEHVSTPETKLALLDLAAGHIKDWLPSGTMPAVGERGGSSSPVEAEDRVEAMKVARGAMRDDKRMKQLCAQLEALGAELYALVVRNVGLVDASKIPTRDPECVSCARPQNPKDKASGHFSDVADPDPHAVRRWGSGLAASVGRLQLCSFCRTHAIASAKANGRDSVVPSRDYPPLKAVDLLCRQSEQAAGLWLAKQRRGAA